MVTESKIIETLKIPAQTDCGIEYDVIVNLYDDDSQTVINCPYIPDCIADKVTDED